MKRIKKVYYAALFILAVMTLYAAIFEKKEMEKIGQGVGEDNITQEAVSVDTDKDIAVEEGDDIEAWQLYENDEGGFRLDVPGDWTVKEDKDGYGNIIVDLIRPKENADNLPADVVVKYSATVANESINKANGYGATTLSGLIEADEQLEKAGETEINGNKAVEFKRSEMDNTCGVFIEKEGRLYEMSFLYRASKGNLTDVERSILETFEIE